MPRLVTIACENRRASRPAALSAKEGFRRDVGGFLTQAGVSVEGLDWSRVERLRVGGASAQMVAALVVDSTSRTPGKCGCQDPATTGSPAGPADSGFAKVVKDPVKWAALQARAAAVGNLDTDRQLYRFLKEDLESQDQEVFLVVGVDSHNQLRLCSEVARGQRDRVAVTVNDILRPVVIEGAAAFAVAHNHPSVDARPSEKDIELTRKCIAGAESLGLVFLDHLVIATGHYYSFRDRKVKRA